MRSRTNSVEFNGRKPLYVPVWKDRIDVGIAKFINTQPNKLDLIPLLLREAEGVYSMNNKRI